MGPLELIVVSGGTVCHGVSVRFRASRPAGSQDHGETKDPFTRLIHRQLDHGIDCPVEFLQTSSFSRFFHEVVGVLSETRAGDRLSYGDVAEVTGRPGAARAVGQALKGNPYPILIPCHRVVRSDGRPGGYGGDRTSRVKSYLLCRERNVC